MEIDGIGQRAFMFDKNSVKLVVVVVYKVIVRRLALRSMLTRSIHGGLEDESVFKDCHHEDQPNVDK